MKFKTSRLVKTRLMPPRKGKFVLPRSRLTIRLQQAEEYRLTIVQAGTGYGKSTVLSVLADTRIPAVWYHLTKEDSDPLTFISHLLVGLDEILGGFSPIPIAQLEEWEQNRLSSAGTILVDSLVNEVAEKLDTPLFIILDDAHLLNESNETCRLLNRFLSHAPSNLHMICATRHPLNLPELVMWRMYEELLEIGQSELAFTMGEISQLFEERYGLILSEFDLMSLHQQIEGWPIALPLIWQNLQKQQLANELSHKRMQASLIDLAGSENLFHYLTREVVNQQQPHIRQFLKQTAVLRTLDSAICNRIRQADDSHEILEYLQAYGLFVVPLESGGLRYHHLFRDVLTNLNSLSETAELNSAAAEIMLAQRREEEAVSHFLDAGNSLRAAEVITYLGRELVNDGRLDTLLGWINRLPETMLIRYPILRVYLGHIERLHSRFDDALDHYRQATGQLRQGDDSATLSYALYSQARVYLDTINPAEADVLLQEAHALIEDDNAADDGIHVQIFDLIAENHLNHGEFEEARNMKNVAVEKGNAATRDRELQARLLLRTGNLRDARQLLLQQLQVEEGQPILKPRAHREPLILLSLTHVLLGNQAEAEKTSLAAMQRGKDLDSHYITAVATSRLGLAYLIRRNSEGDELAKQSFEQAIDLSDRLMVPRLKLLALWGQCQVYGYKGDTEYARVVGNEAISMARKAGDRWIRAGIELFLGAS
ncbi:MAG: LuxR family maltose regulon positive regulatory protein, partial [Cellvibrionaceae bacterium]